MTEQSIPEGSTPERHALETARIAQVFGLTGGDLADAPWRFVDAETGREWVSHWWYDEIPEWLGGTDGRVDHPELHQPDADYRTMVRDIMFGELPASLVDEWERVAIFRSSGETECYCREDDAHPRGEGGAPNPTCPLCEGSGYVYIGDGWAEIVYRRAVEGGEDV